MLVESLREVCRRAGRHDIIVPQLVLVRALAELDGRIGRAGQHRVTTTDIERSVASALAALEALDASEEHREAVGGVAEAWKARAGGKGAAEPPSRAAADARGPVLAVSVASDKSHATIWGKTVKALRDIPSAAARGILEEIMRVEGVRDIRLTKLASASASRGPAVQVMTSKTPGVIEGKLFDKGVRGNVQCFQVRVHDERRKDEVRRGIEERLRGKGWLAE